jgi:hypothetical protein
MRINFTESDIEQMLSIVQENSNNEEQVKVFSWNIDGQEVEITVGDDN